MNEYRAISPNRNDQWSGKILSKSVLPLLATPRRESTHLTPEPIALRGSISGARLRPRPAVPRPPFSVRGGGLTW